MKARTVLSILLVALYTTSAWAGSARYSARLSAASGNAGGAAHFTYDSDTHQLSYFVTYEQLSASATGGGIEDRGDMIVRFPVPQSPISGTATLDDAQARDLQDGRLSVEIATPTFPGGEIRGPVGSLQHP